MGLDKSYNLAIVGRYPPPMGGVTIHSKRLFEQALDNGVDAYFYNISSKAVNENTRVRPPIEFFKFLFFKRNKVVHYQGAHIYGLLILILLKFIFGFKFIWTIHGEYLIPKLKKHKFKHWAIQKISKQVNHVICVNDNILDQISDIFDSYSVVVPFFPPKIELFEKLDLNKFFDAPSKVIVFNAFKIVFNDDGKDIYGLDILVEAMKIVSSENITCNVLLLIPELDEAAHKYIDDKLALLSNQNNVQIHLLSDLKIDGWAYIASADLFVRPTITDGDSLSIREALYYNTPVLSSDCTVRPSGTSLFHNEDVMDFADKIANELKNGQLNASLDKIEVTSFSHYNSIYRN